MDLGKYALNSRSFIYEILDEMTKKEIAAFKQGLGKKFNDEWFTCNPESLKNIALYVSKTPSQRKIFMKNKQPDKIIEIRFGALYHLARIILFYKELDVAVFNMTTSYRSFAGASIDRLGLVSYFSVCDFLCEFLDDY